MPNAPLLTSDSPGQNGGEMQQGNPIYPNTLTPERIVNLKIIFLIFSVGFIACSGRQATTTTSTQPKSAFSFYYDALAEVEAGQFENALANLDSAIVRRPGVANFYQVKGWVFTQLGQADSAIAAYQKCLSYKSHYPEVWISLGKLYMEVKDYENAALYLRKAVQEIPDSTHLQLLLGESYFQTGKYHLAIDFLNAYKKSTHSPVMDYWKWLGMTEYGMGKYDSAIKNLEYYVSVRKDDPVALKYLGLAKFADKKYDEAISYLNQAGEYLPDDTEIYLYRARYFVNVNKPAIAREQLMVGLQHDSTNAELLLQLGVMAYEDEQYETSKEYLHKLIRYHPQFWKAYRYLGFLEERDQHPVQAYQYYKLYLDHSYENDPEVSQRMEKILQENNMDAP